MGTGLQGDSPVELTGPAGMLEGRLMGESALQADAVAGQLIAVVCHPHSLHGGTMQNKVVHTLCRGFREQGIPSVRFNFRGVGSSEGEYAEGVGETEDLLAVIDWVLKKNPRARLLIAGFSFGGFVAARGARSLADAGGQLAGLILIAPAVVNFDFEGLLPVSGPSLVVQGGEDDVVDPQEVAAWVSGLHPSPELIWMDGAGHFFHGMLPELKAGVGGFLQQSQLTAPDDAASPAGDS